MPGSAPSSLAFLLGGVQRRALGELSPFVGAHVARFAFALGEFEQFRDGFAVGHQPGVVLPGVDELRLDLVEDGVDGLLRVVRATRPRLAISSAMP